jgi:hypothetical protein
MASVVAEFQWTVPSHPLELQFPLSTSLNEDNRQNGHPLQEVQKVHLGYRKLRLNS